MKKVSGIVLGGILILCGIVYLLGSFGIADVTVSLDGWWTLFIIVPCLSGLISGEDKIGSLLGLAVGVMLFLAARGVFAYDVIWKAAVPLILILIGVKVILKAVCGKSEDAVQTVSEGEEKMAAFTAKVFDYGEEEFRAAKVAAVFGGANCNLTNTKIADGSHLDLCCVFGGAEVQLPEDVVVKVNAFCLFGGISDKRRVKPEAGSGRTLVINGFCLFGGADIK